MKMLPLAAVAALLTLTACSDSSSNDPTPAPTPASGPFVAKVDGTQFQTDNSKATAKYVTSTKMLQILGQTSDQKETIILNIFGMGTGFTYFTPGTYDFDPAHIARLEYSASAGFTAYQNSTYVNWNTQWDYVRAGSIVIESITPTHVKGRFSFDAVRQTNTGTFEAGNVKKVTEGAFDLDIKRI